MIRAQRFCLPRASESAIVFAAWNSSFEPSKTSSADTNYGCRGFLIYDEGMLWVANEMRKNGDLPKDIIFKCSAHMGYCNPASIKLLADLGADSINPIRDLQIPMHSAIRQAIDDTPLDIHTDNPPGSGGFIRVFEAPEIVRVAAPLHCKTGNSVIGGHGEMTCRLRRKENGRTGHHRCRNDQPVRSGTEAVRAREPKTCVFLLHKSEPCSADVSSAD